MSSPVATLVMKLIVLFTPFIIRLSMPPIAVLWTSLPSIVSRVSNNVTSFIYGRI